MAMSFGPTFTRRRILTGAAATATVAIAMPYLSHASDRPRITHGVQSGDVTTNSGVVWARADRPARMLVEVASTDSFRHIRHATHVDALPETDLTAKALIENLPAVRTFSTASGSRTCPRPPSSAKRRPDAFAPRRMIAARSPSCGRATPPARVGASTNRAAACALTRRC
jgi:hypothetical protein